MALFCAGLKDRMNLCLFCLSLVDGMFVFFFSLHTFCCFTPDIEECTWSVHSNVAGIYRAFLISSGCLTMIISVERCVCVFLPLRATSLIRTRTMAVIVFTTLATIQGICLIYSLKVWTLLQLFVLVSFLLFVSVSTLTSICGRYSRFGLPEFYSILSGETILSAYARAHIPRRKRSLCVEGPWY